ncbi:hypothetical protein IAQ61_001836 [Plenodomus lingam]|uniref:uncharacterized protein n=1 Tax=Leptosphaeria maculans TaxID=5022 RepID=UPI00331AFF63|nr:hypothetical protein IAQ61_001836 [Plenodomus lingam]
MSIDSPQDVLEASLEELGPRSPWNFTSVALTSQPPILNHEYPEQTLTSITKQEHCWPQRPYLVLSIIQRCTGRKKCLLWYHKAKSTRSNAAWALGTSSSRLSSQDHSQCTRKSYYSISGRNLWFSCPTLNQQCLGLEVRSQSSSPAEQDSYSTRTAAYPAKTKALHKDQKPQATTFMY